MRQQDPSVKLADYAANLKYEQLPSEVVHTLKKIILDSLGTTLAANKLGPGSEQLVRLAVETGEAPQSTIIGFGNRVSAMMAAFVNGAMSHALNYDDTSADGNGHLGVVTVPAALAVAEWQGNVNGKDFLAAIAAGAELMARIRWSLASVKVPATQATPQPTQMPGYFAAAASAGRVMNLTSEQMNSAFGLTLMQASGNRQAVLEGRPSKAIYAGFPNQGGVFSALMSKKGISGDCDAFEGEAGLYQTYYGGRYDRLYLEEKLGDKYYLSDVIFKPWPTTRVSHAYVDAAIQLASETKLDLKTVDKIRIIGGTRIRTFCEPAEIRKKPSSMVEAEDSIYFAVAKALLNHNITLPDLQPDGMRQQGLAALTEMMSYAVDDELGQAGVLEISTIHGETYSKRVDIALGHPLNPLTDNQLIDKFYDCASYAACKISNEALREAVELIFRLEQLDDVSVLPKMLSGIKKIGGV